MKTNYLLCGLIALLLLASCEKKEDKYVTSLVRNYDFFLNGATWSQNLGLTGKPIIIYNESGEYLDNYAPYYRFALENGTYKFVASPNPQIITDSSTLTNLNDLVIKQPVGANLDVQISPVVEYKSPFNDSLHFYMVNRTGTLRLRADDLTADASYTTVSATVTVYHSSYKVSDETYVTSPMQLTRTKATPTGGVNYIDDFILFNTVDDQSKVSVHIDLLNAGGQVVRSLDLADKYEILPATVTYADFYLNQ